MAYYQGHRDHAKPPDIIIHNVPERFLLEKLIPHLKKVARCHVSHLKRESSYVTANVQTEEGVHRLLEGTIEISFAAKIVRLRITPARHGKNGTTGSKEITIGVEDFPDKKTVFQYLSRDKGHSNKLRIRLMKVGELTISDDKIIVKKIASIEASANWEEKCWKIVNKFLESYTSWQGHIQNCTAADSEYFASLYSKYKGKCYVCWYKNSHTIKITGELEAVQNVMKDVEQYRKNYEYERSFEPSQEFSYDVIEPAMLRFVFRNKNHHSEFKNFMTSCADAEIIQDGKKLSITCRPRSNWSLMKQLDFTKHCIASIEEYFSQFSSWKQKFASSQVNAGAYGFNDLNHPNLFVKWHWDTCKVDVVGTKQKVIEKQKEIMQMLNGKYQHRRRSSEKEFSIKGKCFNLDIKLPPAVMKFVHKNPNLKEELENGGKKWDVQLKNEKGNLQITHGMVSEIEDCQFYVKKFFSQFKTEILEFDKQKLKQKSNDDVFKSGERTFCQKFVEGEGDTGKVKITGFESDVLDQKLKIEELMWCQEMEETLPVDIFIAQRNCGVWESVEKLTQVLIHPVKYESKIVYKGKDKDIQKAKILTGKLAKKLYKDTLKNLTRGQIEFLQHCKESQHRSLETKKDNKLEALYDDLKKNLVPGSLIFPEKSSEIHLICSDDIAWSKAQRLIQQNIIEYRIKLNDSKSAAWKIALENIKNLPAFVDKVPSTIRVVCHKNDRGEVDKKITEFIQKIEDKQRSYKVDWKKAEHIKRFCSIPEVNKMQWDESKQSLSITCFEEDIDHVDVSMAELQEEIQESHKKFLGYSLYEYFIGEGKLAVENLEKETNCSLFFAPVAKNRCKVQVINGDILDQSCDAIVNSTGRDASNYQNQLSQALLKRYSGYPTLCKTNRKSLVDSELYLIETQKKLPWKFIFHIVTPRKSDLLQKSIVTLLKMADAYSIKTLAIPTIGTGNLGLSPEIVSNCMKQAIAEVLNDGTSNLEEIRVVVYNPQLSQHFQTVKPIDGLNHASEAVKVTVLGTDKQEREQALDKVEQLGCDQIKNISLKYPNTSGPIPSIIKNEIEKICSESQIQVTWKKNGSSQECNLEGWKDKLYIVEDKIKKLLSEDIPHHWQPMSGDCDFVRVDVTHQPDIFKQVHCLFQQSQPSSLVRISKIEEIQNPVLYKEFKVKRDSKAENADPSQVITRQLFHGTKAGKVDLICQRGFDRNFAGENGTAYGRGVYFAVKSSYSMRFTEQHSTKKYMFLADVITGRFTTGKSEYKAPPNDPATNSPFDSLVNNISNPKIFVVFRDSSTYPRYLLTLE